MREEFRNQVTLLLRVLPVLSVADMFALKGGTAINFFLRNFPRLSVDIDLTYLPVKNRPDSLHDISLGVRQIAGEIKKRLPYARVTPHLTGNTHAKLLIQADNAQIKLEVNTVLRGTIYEAVEMELSPALQEEFEMFAVVKSLSFEDLYAGKLCAALDRQHPRDLYDIRLLLNNEGITDRLRKAFIGYLISHSRPINELLNPNLISITQTYHKEFEGMTDDDNILGELTEVQQKLPERIRHDLTDDEKDFLISFKKGLPKWNLMPIPDLKELPGVQWKLMNIMKMDKHKHKVAINKLEQVLMNR